MKEIPIRPRPFLMPSPAEDAPEQEAQLISPAQDVPSPFLAEARFYQRLPDGRVECRLCPRACLLRDGQRGYCGVRENRGGTFYSLVHSRVCAAHVDAIEKKPLFHYLPGTSAFSIATAGCNVNCRFCQNWDISQSAPEDIAADLLPPREVVDMARLYRCPTIAFTYNEPAVFAEYMMDTVEAAHQAGLRCIAVSNGYVQHDALVEAYGRLDAVKIDLKAFSESFYRDVVGGALKPVLDTLTTLRQMGKWMEIVYLVVPTLNDSDDELRAMAAWISTHLGNEVPLHFTRYHPEYRLKDLPPTPVATLDRAREMAQAAGLKYVYIGNVPGHTAQDTCCPGCGKLLVERVGFTITRMLIDAEGACPFCAHAIPGIWHA